MPSIDDILQAARGELTFEFVRASGPGGQNVNKVATSAQLRFDASASSVLPEPARARLRSLAGRRMSADGVLMIEARRYRTQEQNRLDAIGRFDALLRRALEKPKPRVPTKASAASRRKRLESKKHRGEIKRSRQDRSFEA
jgi:ribosome-associated protein